MNLLLVDHAIDCDGSEYVATAICIYINTTSTVTITITVTPKFLTQNLTPIAALTVTITLFLRYTSMSGYAAVLILLLPFGYTLVCLLILFRRRSSFRASAAFEKGGLRPSKMEEAEVEAAKLLYSPLRPLFVDYRHEVAWWYDVMDMGRRLLLCAITATFTQVSSTLPAPLCSLLPPPLPPTNAHTHTRTHTRARTRTRTPLRARAFSFWDLASPSCRW